MKTPQIATRDVRGADRLSTWRPHASGATWRLYLLSHFVLPQRAHVSFHTRPTGNDWASFGIGKCRSPLKLPAHRFVALYTMNASEQSQSVSKA